MLVHGPGAKAGECEEGNSVQDEGSKQASQDHKPEPDHDEHLQGERYIEKLKIWDVTV